MRKLIVLLPLVLLACGESKEEKQKRLNDQFNHNVDSIKKAGAEIVNSLDNQIEANKKADSISAEINKALKK